MNTDTDNEATARADLALFERALQAILSKGDRMTGTDLLIINGSSCEDGGLCAFRDAHQLSAELGVLGFRNLRLNRKKVREINALIRLATKINQSRHVIQNDVGYNVLAGSNGVVPKFHDGEDWIMV